nr:hypothetical protein CFP56_53221 [Quercus suber]
MVKGNVKSAYGTEGLVAPHPICIPFTTEAKHHRLRLLEVVLGRAGLWRSHVRGCELEGGGEGNVRNPRAVMKHQIYDDEPRGTASALCDSNHISDVVVVVVKNLLTVR